MAEGTLNYQTIRTTHAAREAVRIQLNQNKRNDEKKLFFFIVSCHRMIKESKIEKRI